MRDMLTEIIMTSALLFGGGLVGGVVIGFLLYPRLFRGPSGSHRRGGVTSERGPTRPTRRPYVSAGPSQPAGGQFLGRQGLPR